SRSPNFRVDARLLDPHSDNGNLILKWWRVQWQNSLTWDSGATRNEAMNANIKSRKYLQLPPETARNVLVIDVGGTHIKVYPIRRRQPIKIDSGPDMTPKKMIQAVRTAVDGWRYDVVSLGYPGPVVHGKPLHNPVNLGPGWVGFDFQKAFGRPTQIINDAAMQALGSYRGGRMLFLGLGTGLGSALIVDGVLEP